ncbi:hypothetical protein [Aquimarina longa]|uniref:hypothetical protein n=1 Tax=Aquimarina longa TaxID=1080221 RepID=UPI0007847035|nr:hypothetical protein [Aquimarina longa]
MKKIISVVVFSLFVGFTACSSDDDNGNCKQCANGPVSIEVCDNGDGTFSVEGGTAQKIPEGSTFENQFNAACSQIGAN